MGSKGSCQRQAMCPCSTLDLTLGVLPFTAARTGGLASGSSWYFSMAIGLLI